MKLIQDIDNITRPYNNAVVTIGNFDGVHKGHRALFREAIDKARAIDGTAVVITFEPHPLKVVSPDRRPPLITLHDQKVELISKTGVDVLVCIPFTPEFAALPANDFIEGILVKTIGMKAIVVGNDYSFGRNREGDIAMLREFGERLGFDVIVPDWIRISADWKDRVSSTKIRELVMEGNIEDIPMLMDRHYQIRGKVVSGRNRGGKLLGFPTANINLTDELCPKMGVYAVTVEVGETNYKGVANIGYSPTFEDHVFTVEVHILDFEGDIYGSEIRVNFINRLRDEKKFKDIEELSAQIQADIQKARTLLSVE